jgi:NADH-ubiquinone oxidoreductase chain 5
MSAPSPVSALIRAATLVTSGVFLIVRFSHLFELSAVLGPLSVLGVTTAFFAAATGLVQNDFKRIIAYSTCSQLGYMVFVCGLSSYNIAFFRLLNHGCFKALLFLGAGATIHTISNKQDIRYLGNLIQKLPLSYCLFFIGSLALTGFPFMTGFYSKDIIIEVAAINFHSSGTYVYLMSVLTAFMTSLYSTRLIYLVYLNTISSARRARHLTKENGLAISFSLVLLSFASVFNGFVFSEFFVGLGTDYFSNLIFNSPNHFGSILGEFLPAKLKNLPFFLCLCAISVFLVCSSSQSQMLLQLKKSKALFLTFQFLSFRWFFDLIQNKIAFIFLYLGHTLTFKLIDQGLLESLGPSGVFMNYRKSALLRNSQLGFLSHYIFTCVFFTLLLALSLSTPLSLEKLFVVFFFFICWVA